MSHSQRPPITCHVLDTSLGRPAQGVPMELDKLEEGGWARRGTTLTNEDGRAPGLFFPGDTITAGTYRIRFDTASYFRKIGGKTFYPEVAVVFNIEDTSQHYHIPLLLSPFGYSTYRGS